MDTRYPEREFLVAFRIFHSGPCLVPAPRYSLCCVSALPSSWGSWPGLWMRKALLYQPSSYTNKPQGALSRQLNDPGPSVNRPPSPKNCCYLSLKSRPRSLGLLGCWTSRVDGCLARAFLSEPPTLAIMLTINKNSEAPFSEYVQKKWGMC